MSRRCIESLEDTSVTRFRDDQLLEMRKFYNLHQPGRMAESIDRLQEWVQAQPHFKKKDFDRDYLERFLIMCKGSVEAAKESLGNVCAIKTFGTKFFNPEVRLVDSGLQNIFYSTLLPKTTKDLYNVYFVKNQFKTCNASDLRTYFIEIQYMFEYMLKHCYGKGLVVVLDYRLADLGALGSLIFQPDTKDGLKTITKGYAVRYAGIHIISTSKYISVLLQSFGQLMNPKIFGRIDVHQTVEELYEHIDKDILPADYGGKEKPIKELSADFYEALSTDEFRAYCKEMFAATIDTSKKPLDEMDPEHVEMAGTFRTLTVD